MGRGRAMTSSETDFVKLVIYRDSAGEARWIQALRTTADYYGWTEEFEPWRPKVVGESNGYQLFYFPHRQGRGVASGGRRIRICRSTSKNGHPHGLTNQFTVSNSCRAIDLAELAHFTKVDWNWMSSPVGTRISRDRWEEIYQAGGRSRSHVIGGALIR